MIAVLTKTRWMLITLVILFASDRSLRAGDKPFMKYPITMGVERKIITDPTNGHKDIRFYVSVTNTHYLIDTEDLELTLLAFGEYDGRPNVNLRHHRQHKVLDRMLLNQKAKISVPHLETFLFESKLIKSGQADPNHVNHGVWYQGFLAIITDRKGHLIATKFSEQKWRDRYEEIKNIATNRDFPKRFTARLR